jgi:transposase
MPDERCGVLRRRLARREQLVHARTRSKNEIHAVLQRRLQGKPPSTDLFGVKGRHWLAGLELPLEERESVDAAIRHVNFLDYEITEVERVIAQQAVGWPEIRRLVTVPGVNLICAATFMAAIGDVSRFMTSCKLVAYLASSTFGRPGPFSVPGSLPLPRPRRRPPGPGSARPGSLGGSRRLARRGAGHRSGCSGSRSLRR